MKIIEKYTPSKGLLLVITFLCLSLGIQLYVITQVGFIEFVGNKVESDLITVCLFVTYTLTMVSFLFILSEFFLMRKMESLFTGEEIDTIGKSKKDTVVEEIINHNSTTTDEETLVEQDEDPSDFVEKPDVLSDLFVSDDDEVESPEEDNESDSGYKVLEVKIPEKKEEDLLELLPKPDFDMSHVSVDSFIKKSETEPVETEPEPDELEETKEFFDESEILQTLTELKDVVAQLKSKTKGE